MSDQPTLGKFRNSLTSGGDVGRTGAPTPIRLSISAKGMTTHAAQVRIQELTNLKNEWNVLEAEANVHEAKEKAHTATYHAVKAEIDTATAYTGAKEAHWKLETAQVNELIAHTERDVKVASLPLHQARYKAELETLAVQVQEIELELKKLSADAEHTKVMNALNGYSVDIQIPKVQLPKFDALKLEGNRNGQQ